MDYTGKKIEKYVVKRLIGEGGMASVYEAEHEVLGTKAAIKVLNPILSTNAQIRERFLNEAKMMASLQHVNITKIIDFEESDSFLAIIMEFLEGQDLNDRIKSGQRLSEKEIESIFEQTLSAFEYAHGKGVVHRDIKPSNIFILPDGTVKILDFGIAKLLSQGNEMTQTGTQMGTPIYMSPEQVKADKTIDHRSDIYSLGVTLYYALNGKPPYDGNTTSQFDIFNKIVYEPLPELQGNSRFNELVVKACHKDREIRFQSCNEWLVAMKNGVESASKLADGEKTIVHAPVTDQVNVDSPVGDKTVFEAPVFDKTNIEQNPPIQQATQQGQSNSKPTSQAVNQNNVGSKPSNLAVVSLIVGILALVLCWIPAIGIIFGISALVLGILGQKDAHKNPSSNKGLGIAGIIIGSLATLLSIILIVLVVIGISLWGERVQSEIATYNEGENATEEESGYDSNSDESAVEEGAKAVDAAKADDNSDYYSNDQENYINPEYQEEPAPDYYEENGSANAGGYYDDY
jgi:serine/threonine protein kinase